MAWHPAELRYRGRCSVEYFSQHPARQSGVQIWHVSEKYQRSPAVARQGGKTAFQRCRKAVAPRSEEHTSELQSLMRISYAVFCLKKTTSITQHQSRYRTGAC